MLIPIMHERTAPTITTARTIFLCFILLSPWMLSVKALEGYRAAIGALREGARVARKFRFDVAPRDPSVAQIIERRMVNPRHNVVKCLWAAPSSTFTGQTCPDDHQSRLLLAHP